MKQFINNNKRQNNGESVILKKGFPKGNASFAALFNAISTCFLELDEGNRPTGHPSLHVFSTALALSQAYKKTGYEFLTAYILGYEVQYRLHQAFKLGKTVHPHGNFGHVGAIVTIGKIMGWSVEKLYHGINSAASLAITATWKTCLEGATIRNVYPGLSAQTAFTVKTLIESGFTGYSEALNEIFGNILGESVNPYVITENLGGTYGIEKNYFKFHASCALTHPALDAAADALGNQITHGVFPPMKKNKLDAPQTIKKIIVEITNNALRCNVFPQENQLSSKFSIPFAIAVYLIRGDARLENFQSECLSDIEVNKLAKLVFIEENNEMSSRWPDKFEAKVTIHFKDGTFIAGSCSNPFGSSANPPLKTDLYAKFKSLTRNIMHSLESKLIWEQILEIDKNKDMSLFLRN